MKYSERKKVFEELKARYGKFLTSVLWKMTNDVGLFEEAFQLSLTEMYRHVEKLRG